MADECSGTRASHVGFTAQQRGRRSVLHKTEVAFAPPHCAVKLSAEAMVPKHYVCRFIQITGLLRSASLQGCRNGKGRTYPGVITAPESFIASPGAAAATPV